MIRTRPPAPLLLALVLLVPCVARAQDGGVPISGEIHGELSLKEAYVRAVAAKVTIRATASRQSGFAIGVDRYDEARGTITVHNLIDHGVRDAVADLTLMRESATGSARGRDKGEGDDETGNGEAAQATPIGGWKFTIRIGELLPLATRTVPFRFTLGPLDAQERPESIAQLTFAVEVTDYRVPELPLSRALEVMQRGTPDDQRAIWKDYGSEIHGDARAFDEQILLGLLGVSPSREGRWLSADIRRSPEAPRTPLAFAFLLQVARRIGGQPTLEGLILYEKKLVASAPPLPPRLDQAHPPPNYDLLPDSIASAVHETIVEVAHHNIAGLYLILHPNPPPPPEVLVDAAHQLAVAEGLDDPDSWMEAAAALGPDVPQFNPDTDREGRLPIVPILAKYGGPEANPALARALDADESNLREEAAAALSHRGDAGITLLVVALDNPDEEQRRPIEEALAALEGPDRAALERAVRQRGLPVDSESIARDLVVEIEKQLQEKRAVQVRQKLAEAEQLVVAGTLDATVDARVTSLLADAKELSPTAYAAARDQVGKIAAFLYHARVAAGRDKPRAVLDEASQLGPISGPEWNEAQRDARIADARLVAIDNLDAALDLLGDRGPGNAVNPPTDPVLRGAARSLILAKIDDALDRRDQSRAAALLTQARLYGAPRDEMDPRESRLIAVRTRPIVIAASATALVVAALVLWLRRRRRQRAAQLAARRPPQP